MKKKIVTFGEILFRLSKEKQARLTQGRAFNGDFGGSEANVAVSLATLGDQVEYVTRVPNNAMGHAALMHLREFGQPCCVGRRPSWQLFLRDCSGHAQCNGGV